MGNKNRTRKTGKKTDETKKRTGKQTKKKQKADKRTKPKISDGNEKQKNKRIKTDEPRNTDSEGMPVSNCLCIE